MINISSIAGVFFPVCQLRQLERPKVLSTGYNLLTGLRNTICYCVEVQTFFKKKGLHTERLEPLVMERDKNKTHITVMGTPYAVEEESGKGRCGFKNDL